MASGRATMRSMEVMEALRGRRSIGKLDGDIDDAQVRELVEAAIHAPNHKLTEPWRFTVVRGDARVRLGAAWADCEAGRTTLTGAERDAYLRREAQKPLRAPVLIVVSTRTDADPIVAQEDFAASAAAVQNLLLAAHARGFGAMWRTGAMAYDQRINEHLGVERSDRIVAIVYLGRAAMPLPRDRPRNVEAVLRTLS
ncbi:MAG: nitroreductase [Candidatus Eremiobacteraeota bacterium]|nr:nitroreductase [Candidatus Eremiobacteraeota bacterium]MBC5823200.1 nitroreductase [Candidatus Eremiobacteraeota bacterium]